MSSNNHSLQVVVALVSGVAIGTLGTLAWGEYAVSKANSTRVTSAASSAAMDDAAVAASTTASLSCDGDDVRALVASILKENPQLTECNYDVISIMFCRGNRLLDVATEDARRQAGLQCGDFSDGTQCQPSVSPLARTPAWSKDSELRARFDRIKDQALHNATYLLDQIRLRETDNDTGALVCAARINVEVSDYGAASSGIIYKVEKTTDGDTYVTVLKL